MIATTTKTSLLMDSRCTTSSQSLREHVQIPRCTKRIADLLGFTAAKEHCMSPFLDVFATRIQSRLNDRKLIVGASNVVDVLG